MFELDPNISFMDSPVKPENDKKEKYGKPVNARRKELLQIFVVIKIQFFVFVDNAVFVGRIGARQARIRLTKVWRSVRIFIKKGCPQRCFYRAAAKKKEAALPHCWCSEEYNPNNAYYFNLKNGNNDWNNKNNTNNNDRVALAFLIEVIKP